MLPLGWHKNKDFRDYPNPRVVGSFFVLPLKIIITGELIQEMYPVFLLFLKSDIFLLRSIQFLFEGRNQYLQDNHGNWRSVVIGGTFDFNWHPGSARSGLVVYYYAWQDRDIRSLEKVKRTGRVVDTMDLLKHVAYNVFLRVTGIC